MDQNQTEPKPCAATGSVPWMTMCIAVMCCLCFYGGYRSARQSRCHHDGRLDKIGPTWRVDASGWTDNIKTVLGICKACGAITDAEQSGVINGEWPWRSHFPVAGAPSNAPVRFNGATVTNVPAKKPNGNTLL